MTDAHDYLESTEFFGGLNNPTPRQTTRGGNAELRFTAGYESADDGNSWTLKSVREEPRQTDRIGTNYQLIPLNQLLEPHSGQWMDEYDLSENIIKVVGRESVDNESCVVLDVTYMRNGEVDGNGSRVWLAEEKGFLIKKVTPNEGPPTGRRDADYLCEEFRQVEKHWSPYRCQVLLPPDNSAWKVLSFEINPPLTRDVFRPPVKDD